MPYVSSTITDKFPLQIDNELGIVTFTKQLRCYLYAISILVLLALWYGMVWYGAPPTPCQCVLSLSQICSCRMLYMVCVRAVAHPTTH
jgi:hypothetical protein